MTDDWLDFYPDIDPSDAGALLDRCIQQIEYHRDELIRWRRLKQLVEDAIGRDPVDEMVEIARTAWQRSS